MDKRYQVFISSTYSDLKDERQAVIQTLMEMDCIPAGMELFPATDEEQWMFIKRIIDDCDYYILIIGGRYGSVAEGGISYTEMEFDYALEKGIKVIALVHKDAESLPFAKVEASPESREKLIAFREKVCTGRLVKFWSNPGELPGLVALSLQKTIKMYPALGWVRGGQTASSEVLNQINELRIENERLKKYLEENKEKQEKIPEDISGGKDVFEIPIQIVEWFSGESVKRPSTAKETWDGIFSMIAPFIISPKSDKMVKMKLQSALKEKIGLKNSIEVQQHTINVIGAQFSYLKLIKIFPSQPSKSGQETLWQTTENGVKYLHDMLIVRKG